MCHDEKQSLPARSCYLVVNKVSLIRLFSSGLVCLVIYRRATPLKVRMSSIQTKKKGWKIQPYSLSRRQSKGCCCPVDHCDNEKKWHQTVFVMSAVTETHGSVEKTALYKTCLSRQSNSGLVLCALTAQRKSREPGETPGPMLDCQFNY